MVILLNRVNFLQTTILPFSIEISSLRRSTMGGKSSKSSLSDEDLHFLVTNTNMSKEEIQVTLFVIVAIFTVLHTMLNNTRH